MEGTLIPWLVKATLLGTKHLEIKVTKRGRPSKSLVREHKGCKILAKTSLEAAQMYAKRYFRYRYYCKLVPGKVENTFLSEVNNIPIFFTVERIDNGQSN